jgi:hypothetical protein
VELTFKAVPQLMAQHDVVWFCLGVVMMAQG